jgi:tetratricopeptide (TPR) repeat protein
VRQSAAIRGQIELLLQEAGIYQREAKWPQAIAALKRAEALLASLGDSEALRRRMGQLRRDVSMAADLELLRLDFRTLRMGGEGSGGVDEIDHSLKCFELFQGYGIDLEALSIDHAARLIRESPICDDLLSALDHCARLLSNGSSPDDAHDSAKRQTMRRQVIDVAQLADTDELRNQVRQAVKVHDVHAMRALATSDRVLDLPASTIDLLAIALSSSDSRNERRALLRSAQLRHPDDFWINENLTYVSDATDSVRFHTAAISCRPNGPGYVSFGWTLVQLGRLDEAIEIYKEAIRRWPEIPNLYSGFGQALERQGRLDEAATQYREALRVDPTYGNAHQWLGNIMLRQGKLDEAVRHYRDSVRSSPRNAFNRVLLFEALLRKGSTDEAIKVCREIPEALRREKLGGAIRRFQLVRALHERVILAQLGKKQSGPPASRLDSASIDIEPLLRETVRLCRALVAEFPDNKDYKSRLAALEKLHAEYFGKSPPET